MDMVAKHNSKESCWIVINGKVLDVTKFMSDHPGGELSILTFAGKDASEEFGMIHPPDVIGKYAADTIIGEIGGALPLVATIPAKVSAAQETLNTLADTSGSSAEADGGCLTMDVVAKHNSKESCWVVIDGKVLDVTKFLTEHPGGELSILTFAGKDATEEFGMIHPPDVIGKYAADTIIGEIGDALPPVAASAAEVSVAQEAPKTLADTSGVSVEGSGGCLTMDVVAKHNSKESCWIVINGKVLDVTKFMSDHPGGELSILTFAGKDASEEFGMIHPPDVIGKYAADTIIGEIGGSRPRTASLGGA